MHPEYQSIRCIYGIIEQRVRIARETQTECSSSSSSTGSRVKHALCRQILSSHIQRIKNIYIIHTVELACVHYDKTTVHSTAEQQQQQQRKMMCMKAFHVRARLLAGVDILLSAFCHFDTLALYGCAVDDRAPYAVLLCRHRHRRHRAVVAGAWLCVSHKPVQTPIIRQLSQRNHICTDAHGMHSFHSYIQLWPCNVKKIKERRKASRKRKETRARRYHYVQQKSIGQITALSTCCS